MCGSQGQLFERLELRYVLDGALVSLTDDFFDVHQNSPSEQFDVLGNDLFENVYAGQRAITSVSYGSEGGTAEISADRQSIRYAPPADYFGVETFVYVVDGQHTATVNITISTPLSFDEFHIPPDGLERRLPVMANDDFWPGYDGPRVITSLSVTSAGGAAVRSADQQAVLYTPPQGPFTKDEFIYIVDHIYPARVTISIPETLESDRFEVVQNAQGHRLPVLSNDPFWPGYTGQRRITHVADTHEQAMVQIADDGHLLLYSPPLNFSGWDSFRYVVDATYEASVSIRIHRPVRDDSFEIDENSTEQLLVLTTNDNYRDLNNITRDVVTRVTAVSDLSSGTAVEIAGHGQGVIYTPPQGFSGTDRFTYLADGLHQAQVTINVTRPVRSDHISQGVYQDTPGASLAVLANDFMGNGYTGPKQITGVGPTEQQGKVLIAADRRSLIYHPPPGYVGPDQFNYTVDSDLSADVTVSIQSLAQSDYDNFCADPFHGPYWLDVLSNDHFQRGYPGPGLITSVSEPSNGGEITIAGRKALLFVPGTSGWDSFRYSIDDQYEASVSVSITGHLTGDLFVVDQNSPFGELDVLSNDFTFNHRRTCKSQHYRGTRVISGVSESQQGGTVSVNDDGRTVHYQPPADFYGDDSFTYAVDGVMEAIVRVHVIRRVRDDQFRVHSENDVESLPVLVNDLFAADYRGAQQITAVSGTSAGGDVTVGDDGRSVDYAPPPNFVGTDTFTYTVDGALKADVRVIVDAIRDDQFPRFGTLAQYQEFLIDDALERYEHLFGQPAWSFHCFVCLPGPEWAADGQDRSHSETNVQVEGVDEGDIVEFDADFVYMLTEDELVIVDAWPAAELSVASRVDIEGTPLAEFLKGDRLTVISQLGGDFFPWEPLVDTPNVDVNGFSCWPPFPTLPASTTVTVLDVSDRTSPSIVQITTMEGSYVESRAIGDYVYVLVRNDQAVAPLPLVKTSDQQDAPGEEFSEGEAYETRGEYLERFNANPGTFVDAALPNYSSYGRNSTLVRTGLLNEPEAIYRPLLPDAENLISVVSFRITEDEPGLASTSGVYGSGASTVYASLDNFYVFDYDYESEDGALTRIIKFDWDSNTGDVNMVASTRVPGSILNQFSADEHDGYLRIATTISNSYSGNWSNLAENTLFVLQEDEGVFEFVGSLQNLALGETMRSIRYMSERAFVTTFRDVDPLFGLDLSDPVNPRSVGHLTLPGFSSYMQLIDDSHLLTVGKNTPNGFGGPTQVSLFDISQLNQPRRIDEYTFERFSTSEAELDHHAFGYFATHGLLAIPTSQGYIQRVDNDGDGYRETRVWVQEEHLAIMAIDATGGDGIADPGIKLVGRIKHDTTVRRSGYIGDKLYSIASDSVKVVDVATPSVVISALTVVEPVEPDEPITIHFPATLPEGPLASAIQHAQTQLADHVPEAADASMLVTAEPTTSASGGGWIIVLQMDENRYVYRARATDSVALVQDHYDFHDLASQHVVWHAVLPTLVVQEGDVNIDGNVDARDIDLLYAQLGAHQEHADLDGDGIVDVHDADLLIHTILGTRRGDADLDGDVDISDFHELVTHFDPVGQETHPSWSVANFNGDSKVDIFDFNFLVRNFNPLGHATPVDENDVPLVGSDYSSVHVLRTSHENDKQLRSDVPTADDASADRPVAQHARTAPATVVDKAFATTRMRRRSVSRRVAMVDALDGLN